MISIRRIFFLLWLMSGAGVQAQVPALLNYQGRLLTGTGAFDGTGQFKFSLVNASGTQIFWSNSPDADSNGEPDSAISLGVSRGLYSVLLGDTALPNMAAVPVAALGSGDVYLRVWFNDGVSGFQRLSPDQRIASVAYAFVAASVPDGSITGPKIASGAVTSSSISGTLLAGQIPDLDATKITSGILDPARLPANVALKNPDLQNATAALQTQIDTLRTQVALLGSSSGIPPGVVQASTHAADLALIGLGYASFASFPAASWFTSTALNGPSSRFEHAAVWTGGFGQMFVWGGQFGANSFSGTGALHRPGTDTWQDIPATGAPTARRGHSMVWDGNDEAIVWGGFSDAGYLNTGARFDLGDFAWKPVASANAQAGRDAHIALRAGTLMLIWGGRNGSGKLGDGALYDNANNSWSALTLPGAPTARSEAAAVWTGDRVIVWGGASAAGSENTGKQLIFQTAPSVAPTEWRAMAALNAPSARSGHTAVWTGTNMIVWGGRNGGTLLGDGASYNPATDTWTALPGTDAPSPRTGHTAIWTGEEMVIFGGDTGSGATATGAAFNPVSNRWRALTVTGNPLARSEATAVWSGTEMIVFGGRTGALPVASLQRLNPQPAWYLYRKL